MALGGSGSPGDEVGIGLYEAEIQLALGPFQLGFGDILASDQKMLNISKLLTYKISQMHQISRR